MLGAVLSVVTPIFNERENLPELARRLSAAAGAVGAAVGGWEVVFVDDGSSDGSGAMLADLAAADDRLKVVTLSRNFGHQPAITAGLAHAAGEAIVLIDGDLQDPPELIGELVEAWRGGAQVVLAERTGRDDAVGGRGLGFRLFYPVLKLLSDLPEPPGSGIFGLLDRRVADELLKLPERNRFIPGLRSWLGFEVARVSYHRADRAGGEPKQTLGRLVRYAADAVVSFSTKPLRLAIYLGLLSSVAAFGLALFYVGEKILLDKPPNGFTTIIVCVLLLGGVQLVTVGILGEYVGRIYDEVKQRPLYVVSRRQGFDAKPVVRREVRGVDSHAPTGRRPKADAVTA